MSTLLKVQELVAPRTSPPLAPDTISADALLVDLGLDDFDKIELIMDIEELFNIEVVDDAHESFKTLADIVDFCESIKAKAA